MHVKLLTVNVGDITTPSEIQQIGFGSLIQEHTDYAKKKQKKSISCILEDPNFTSRHSDLKRIEIGEHITNYSFASSLFSLNRLENEGHSKTLF